MSVGSAMMASTRSFSSTYFLISLSPDPAPPVNSGEPFRTMPNLPPPSLAGCIFENEDFGYRTITVERPERDKAGKVVLATKGKLKGMPQPDADLRDTENVPLSEDVEEYFTREVLPHAADAWIDEEKTKVGYEIPFNRHFYVFKPPRPLAEIDAELKTVTDKILEMIGGLTK